MSQRQQANVRIRVLAVASGLVTLLACQNQNPLGQTPVITVRTSPPRGLASPDPLPPTPPPTPTPRATSPRDLNPPLPPTTPVPVPTSTALGGNIGGPTPSPVLTPTPGLALKLGEQAPDTWLAGPPLLRPRAGLVAAALSGVLVAAEGAPRPSVELLALGEGPGAAWRLNDQHDSHKATGKFLAAGISLMAGGATGTTLFTAGGANGSLTATISRYGLTGYVDQVASLDTPVKAAAGGLIGDTLLTCGGAGLDSPIATVQRLNITTGVSSTGVPMPAAVAGAASAVLDGKLWVLGGYTFVTNTGFVTRSQVMVYDPVANAWRSSDDGQPDAPAPLPEVRHSGAAVAFNGKLYLLGGVGTGGTLLSNVLCYDPPTRIWKPVAGMPTPRALLAAVAANGKIWTIGGRDNTGQTVTTTEVYQP